MGFVDLKVVQSRFHYCPDVDVDEWLKPLFLSVDATIML